MKNLLGERFQNPFEKRKARRLYVDNSHYDVFLTPEEYAEICTAVQGVALDAGGEAFSNAAQGPMTVVANRVGAELNALATRAAADCDGTETDFKRLLQEYTNVPDRFCMIGEPQVSVTLTDQHGNPWGEMAVANSGVMGYTGLAGATLLSAGDFPSDESAEVSLEDWAEKNRAQLNKIKERRELNPFSGKFGKKYIKVKIDGITRKYYEGDYEIIEGKVYMDPAVWEKDFSHVLESGSGALTNDRSKEVDSMDPPPEPGPAPWSEQEWTDILKEGVLQIKVKAKMKKLHKISQSIKRA